MPLLILKQQIEINFQKMLIYNKNLAYTKNFVKIFQKKFKKRVKNTLQILSKVVLYHCKKVMPFVNKCAHHFPPYHILFRKQLTVLIAF